MRGIEKLIMIAFVGLVALGIWNVRGWLSQRLQIATSAFSAPTSKPAVPTIINPAKKKRSKTRGPGGTKETTVTPDGVTIVDVPYTGLPFPEPKDLPSGITASEIRAGFGDPAAHVTLSSNGQLVERYYYVNQERTRFTIAELQDGRLISASSRPL